MARLSLKGLQNVVTSYVDSQKISVESFEVTRNNIVGLLDKVGKIMTLDTSVYDKLPELDGELLSYGKVVEEWQLDMTLPLDYQEDGDGTKALANYVPTARPVSYSYSLGKKVFPTSIPYNNIERAVHFEAQLVEIVSKINKKLEDSIAAYKYGLKRELVGKTIGQIHSNMSGATAYTASSTALAAGTWYKATIDGAVVTAVSLVTQTASSETFAQLLASGKLVEVKMIKNAPLPVDEASGESFIKAVKEVVEKAKDISEGYSFNGGVLGVEEGLSLYLKQGIMPSIEVDTLAGAFHREDLALGVNAKVVKDFGSDNSSAFAILMDSRAIRLFQGYNGTFSQENGFGARMNIFRHLEYTGHVSRNAFIVIFEPAA